MNFYERSTDPVGSPAIRSAAFEDLYLTLLAFDQAGPSASFNAWIFPMVSWIWWSLPFFVLGALFAAWPERRRARADAAERVRRAEQGAQPRSGSVTRRGLVDWPVARGGHRGAPLRPGQGLRTRPARGPLPASRQAGARLHPPAAGHRRAGEAVGPEGQADRHQLLGELVRALQDGAPGRRHGRPALRPGVPVLRRGVRGHRGERSGLRRHAIRASPSSWTSAPGWPSTTA